MKKIFKITAITALLGITFSGCNEEILETLPLEFNVYPNPEGIIQEENQEESPFFNNFNFQPFDNPNLTQPQKEKSKSPQKTRKI